MYLSTLWKQSLFVWIWTCTNNRWKPGLRNNSRIGGGFISWCIFCFYQKTPSCWLAAHWQSRRDSMASKGNAVLKPALAPSETCSDLTLNCKGIVSILGWCRSANKHVPVRGREGKSVLTLQDLCLLNQIKRKYQLLRIHPIISILQRTVELRCPSRDRLYLWARKQWRSRACFSPHWGHGKICLKKNWWSFSKEVTIFLPFPAAASVLSHCSHFMAVEQVQGRRFGR